MSDYKIINERYKVHMAKLRQNRLEIRYVNGTQTRLAGFPTEEISDAVRDVLLDLIDERYNKRHFDMLSTDDKRLVRLFIRRLKIQMGAGMDTSMSKEEDEMQEQYKVVLNQFIAGNNSPAIKATLKEYILLALRHKMMNRDEALGILMLLA